MAASRKPALGQRHYRSPGGTFALRQPIGHLASKQGSISLPISSGLRSACPGARLSRFLSSLTKSRHCASHPIEVVGPWQSRPAAFGTSPRPPEGPKCGAKLLGRVGAESGAAAVGVPGAKADIRANYANVWHWPKAACDTLWPSLLAVFGNGVPLVARGLVAKGIPRPAARSVNCYVLRWPPHRVAATRFG